MACALLLLVRRVIRLASAAAGYTLADTYIVDFYDPFDPCKSTGQPTCEPTLPKITAAIALYLYVGFFSCGMVRRGCQVADTARTG